MNNQSEQIGELAKALSAFQGKLEGVEKEAKNPFFKSKYADLHSVWQAIRQPLAENGLSVTQIGAFEHEKECIVTILMHSSGQWIKSVMPIITAKADIQAYGAAVTYLKRYSLQAICGCSSYDDDGEEAMKGAREAKEGSLKPKIEAIRTLEDLCKPLIDFAKEDIQEYVKYIAITKGLQEIEVIQNLLATDESFKSFRDKLKARVDKKSQAS